MTSSSSEPPRVRFALALVAAAVTATTAYALLRVLQLRLFPEPDPALVLWSEHSGYFWRAWIASYAGGTAAFVAWLASAKDAARVARLLATAVLIAAGGIGAQGMLVP